MSWDVRALDIPHSFLQRENLQAMDRLIVLSAPMAQLHREGQLGPIGAVLKTSPSPKNGFLTIRPLYGGEIRQ